MNWLKNLFGSRKIPAEGTLDVNREVQSLRLELEERERTIANLKIQLERTLALQREHLERDVQLQVEKLISDAALPVAQLTTQAYLTEVEGKDVSARDVIAVARRLIRALESAGLAVEGKVGDTVSFAPPYHEPLSSSISIAPGEKAVIRFVGISHKDKIIRKAGVERCQGD